MPECPAGEPLAQERHTGPCAGWETRGHGVTTRPAEGRARMIAVAERRVEARRKPRRRREAASAWRRRRPPAAKKARARLNGPSPDSSDPSAGTSQAAQHDLPAAEFQLRDPARLEPSRLRVRHPR